MEKVDRRQAVGEEREIASDMHAMPQNPWKNNIVQAGLAREGKADINYHYLDRCRAM